jgi:segregation and condensation protein A
VKGGLYTVKTENFEGPLDLLLDLVSKRKLFVNDISLSDVTDDFIRYIEGHDDFPLNESAEFILVASTLMLIKSRSLLPMIELTEEEEESIVDLEHRLALYARTKELASKLRGIYGKEIIFEKTPSKSQVVIFSPDSKMNSESLLTALQQLLDTLPKKELVPKVVVQKVITLEETINKLVDRISNASRMKFSDFSGEDRVTIIVGFLAMLELVHRGLIRVSQEADGEIEMERELEPANSSV